MSFDRVVRRLIPSVSKLTFNPIFKALVNGVDILPRIIYPEFRTLPPNHLRIRIGVGNRILNNHVNFLIHARNFWIFVFTEGLADSKSSIMDIGSGCGRWAHWLRDYDFQGLRFTGQYVGIDIDAEAIAWCEKHYDRERFRFHRSTHSSSSYNQRGEASAYRIPEPDASMDLVTSSSLLSHVLEAELENYLQESFRVLRPGGAALHSHYNLDFPPATYGTRHTFQHTMGNAQVESLRQPEAAVAYRTDYLMKVARDAGFRDCSIVRVPSGGQLQQMLLCRN